MSALVASLVIASLAAPQTPDFHMRVIDTGAGCATVTRVPSSRGYQYVVFDTGLAVAEDAFKAFIPPGEEIDWLILSHNDKDHISCADELLKSYDVKRVVWLNYPRPTLPEWVDANEAIRREGAYVWHPEDRQARPGRSYRVGDGLLTFIAGHSSPPSSWGSLSGSEDRNAGSIIVRLEYKGKSILLTGDCFGSKNGRAVAAEKDLVANMARVPFASTVVFAPHHGSGHSSSTDFIEAAAPSYVIFPSGSSYGHPRKETADRYKAFGVPESQMFRTDLGDMVRAGEWSCGSLANGRDKEGDDHIDIRIRGNEQISIRYSDRLIPW